jgi:23S rRNA pseudouridine1911/1915/1917 synthase
VDVLYIDEYAAVVNKRSGLRMESLVDLCRNTLIDRVSTLLEGEEQGSDLYEVDSVSRLDQATSGVVVLPLCLTSHKYLTELFKNRIVDKYYVCITAGSSPLPKVGEVDVKLKHTGGETLKTFAHPQGKPSLTKFAVLATFCLMSSSTDTQHIPIYYHIVVCKPVTGRTHQIRSHMAHIGQPLVGDAKYARNFFRRAMFRTHDHLLADRRTMLHSYAIRYENKDNESIVNVRATIPEDMRFLISALMTVAQAPSVRKEISEEGLTSLVNKYLEDIDTNIDTVIETMRT